MLKQSYYNSRIRVFVKHLTLFLYYLIIIIYCDNQKTIAMQ